MIEIMGKLAMDGMNIQPEKLIICLLKFSTF